MERANWLSKGAWDYRYTYKSLHIKYQGSYPKKNQSDEFIIKTFFIHCFWGLVGECTMGNPSWSTHCQQNECTIDRTLLLFFILVSPSNGQTVNRHQEHSPHLRTVPSDAARHYWFAHRELVEENYMYSCKAQSSYYKKNCKTYILLIS